MEGEVPLLPDFTCRQNYNSPHGWLAFARLLRKELISVRAPSSHSFSSIACCSTSLTSKSSWTQTFNMWAWDINKMKIIVELDLSESILWRYSNRAFHVVISEDKQLLQNKRKLNDKTFLKIIEYRRFFCTNPNGLSYAKRCSKNVFSLFAQFIWPTKHLTLNGLLFIIIVILSIFPRVPILIYYQRFIIMSSTSVRITKRVIIWSPTSTPAKSFKISWHPCQFAVIK